MAVFFYAVPGTLPQNIGGLDIAHHASESIFNRPWLLT
jgi:hypothetical protein